MSKIEDLIVFQKTYDFLVWLKIVIRRLAKVHKYSLGIQIEDESVRLMRQIARANLTREDKREKILECLETLEIIKALLRIGHEFNRSGGISVKYYEKGSEMLVEIGRLLGGWREKFK